jgi:hypothetical protein
MLIINYIGLKANDVAELGKEEEEEDNLISN